MIDCDHAQNCEEPWQSFETSGLADASVLLHLCVYQSELSTMYRERVRQRVAQECFLHVVRRQRSVSFLRPEYWVPDWRGVQCYPALSWSTRSFKVVCSCVRCAWVLARARVGACVGSPFPRSPRVHVCAWRATRSPCARQSQALELAWASGPSSEWAASCTQASGRPVASLSGNWPPGMLSPLGCHGARPAS